MVNFLADWNLFCDVGNEDEEAEQELRRFAVSSYMDLPENPVLPDILVQVICWVCLLEKLVSEIVVKEHFSSKKLHKTLGLTVHAGRTLSRVKPLLVT